MESEGVLLMYQDMYERWLAAELDDADLKPELESVKGDDAAIQDRFAVALKFGTAGLRGVIGQPMRQHDPGARGQGGGRYGASRNPARPARFTLKPGLWAERQNRLNRQHFGRAHIADTLARRPIATWALSRA